MFVKLKFRKNGQLYAMKKEISVKEAKEFYDKELKNDNTVTEVYLVKFGDWYWHKYKTLKEIKT